MIRFVTLRWRCVKCRKQGTTRVFRRPQETRNETSKRNTRETRDHCVTGCAYGPMLADRKAEATR